MKLSRSPKTEIFSRLAILTTLLASPACSAAQEKAEEPKSCTIQQNKAELEKDSEDARKNAEDAYESLMRSTGAAQNLLDSIMEGHAEEPEKAKEEEVQEEEESD